MVRLRLYKSRAALALAILFLHNQQIHLQNQEPNFLHRVYNQPLCGHRALVAVAAGSFAAAGVPALALYLLHF